MLGCESRLPRELRRGQSGDPAGVGRSQRLAGLLGVSERCLLQCGALLLEPVESRVDSDQGEVALHEGDVATELVGEDADQPWRAVVPAGLRAVLAVVAAAADDDDDVLAPEDLPQRCCDDEDLVDPGLDELVDTPVVQAGREEDRLGVGQLLEELLRQGEAGLLVGGPLPVRNLVATDGSDPGAGQDRARGEVAVDDGGIGVLVVPVLLNLVGKSSARRVAAEDACVDAQE